VLGNTGGLYVQVVAVALGVGAIVEASVELYTVLKLAGAAYLVYLGVQAIPGALGGSSSVSETRIDFCGRLLPRWRSTSEACGTSWR